MSIADWPLSSTFLYWVHLIFSICSVKRARMLFFMQRDVVSSIWVTSEHFWEQNQPQNVCVFVLVLTAQLLEAVPSADGPAPPSAVYLFILVSQVWLRSWLQFSDLGNPCGRLASLFSLLSWLHVGEGPGESGCLSRLFLVDLPRIAILCFRCACCQMSFCYFTVHVLW